MAQADCKAEKNTLCLCYGSCAPCTYTDVAFEASGGGGATGADQDPDARKQKDAGIAMGLTFAGYNVYYAFATCSGRCDVGFQFGF